MSILYMKAILFLFNVKIFHQNKMSPQQLTKLSTCLSYL